MVMDNEPSHPMAFTMQLELAGQIDREALEAAIEETLVRNPLLSARVEHIPRRGPCFVPAPDLQPPLDWNQEGVPIRYANGEWIDLTRELGLRLWVRQGTDRASFTAQFHHSCADGIGACRFLGDLFAAYGRRTTTAGRPPELAPIDPELLHSRGQFQFEPPEPVSTTRVVWSTVCEAVKWGLRRPAPLAVPPVSDPSPDRADIHYNAAFHEFDEAQSRLLRQHGSRLKATVNDLLLRDLFLTMRDWNRQYAPRNPGKWLQINMPQSLRERGCERMPAANKMGYVFLARRAAQLADPQALLDGVRWETAMVKQWSLGLFFISGLEWTQKIPRLSGSIARRNRCLATALLTNLGDFGRRLSGAFPYDEGRLVFGNLRFDRCRVLPPVRRLTRAGFVVATYARRLNISVRCDPDEFSPKSTREMLGRYIQRITETISQESQSS